MNNFIVIKGAKEHNLKNITLSIPRDKLIVITGISGSGKSSLAFDTIYAEGQRRYIESLSAYARQFLEQLKKPGVDSIEGLSPSISIDQSSGNKNPRSTVGTITETYDYLRLLYSKISKPFCYQCKNEIVSQSPENICSMLVEKHANTQVSIFSPVIRHRKGEFSKELNRYLKYGFSKVKIDGALKSLDDKIDLEKNKHHDISILIDRLLIHASTRQRLKQSIETSLKFSQGLVIVDFLQNSIPPLFFSETLSCPRCAISYPLPEPRMFSFNSPIGYCPSCKGLGDIQVFDERLIDQNRMLLGEKYRDISSSKLAPLLLKRYEDTNSNSIRETLETLMSSAQCPECNGLRLKKDGLSFKIDSRSIQDISNSSIQQNIIFFKTLSLAKTDLDIASKILKEIISRLEFLSNVGLGYLTLARPAATLSGGEAQRVKLANQIGSSLVGVIYVLDEPSIGLHQSDNLKLIQTLLSLRDAGNTVIVVEHDEETMLHADHIIDLGPGAGIHGGEVVAEGTPEQIVNDSHSITGRFLSKKEVVHSVNLRKPLASSFLELKGATHHNLKNINLRIPLGNLTCVTGVSGSGKSSLIIDTLLMALKNSLFKSNYPVGKHTLITGNEALDSVIDVDQSPIGRTPRSNAATFTGVFTPIRDIYAKTPEARMKGFNPSRFSFNVKGGRCEACMGDGLLKIEMHFLPNVYVPCDVCKKRRYNKETLEIKYKEKSIFDVLEMTVEEALTFFDRIPTIKTKLSCLNEVGLGYLRLGQSGTTLSGGEAQRVKLSKELSKKSTGKTLYILDEPTTGLHFADIKNLLHVLNKLIEAGNTIIVIEHNIDVIKSADYIIDLGPEGGDAGGYIVAKGTPEEIVNSPASKTGEYLKKKYGTI